MLSCNAGELSDYATGYEAGGAGFTILFAVRPALRNMSNSLVDLATRWW